MKTLAGEVLDRLVAAADDRDCDFPQVANTFIEGAHDTASVWVQHGGAYYQVHVTKLDPTESDLEFYRTYRRGGGA